MSPAPSERPDWVAAHARILDAAADLFAQRPPDAVPLDEVARAAGVGRATVFRHVGTKEALVVAVYDRRAQEVLAAADRALAAEEPWDGVELLVRALGSWMGLDRGLLADPAAELSEAAATVRYAEVVDRIDAVLRRARVAGELAVDIGAVELIRMLRPPAGAASGTSPVTTEVILRGLRASTPPEEASRSTKPASQPGPEPIEVSATSVEAAPSHSPGPAGPRAARSEISRRRILDAAVEIASDRGLEGTTMALVSRRAGLPVTSLYWHFSSKDELLAEMVARSAQRWRADIATILSVRAPPHESADLVELLGQVVRAGILGSPVFLRIGLMLALERRRPALRAREVFLAQRDEGFRSLLALVEPMLNVPPEHRAETARSVVALFQAFVDGLVVAREAATADDGVRRPDIDELDRQLELLSVLLRSVLR